MTHGQKKSEFDIYKPILNLFDDLRKHKAHHKDDIDDQVVLPAKTLQNETSVEEKVQSIINNHKAFSQSLAESLSSGIEKDDDDNYYPTGNQFSALNILSKYVKSQVIAVSSKNRGHYKYGMFHDIKKFQKQEENELEQVSNLLLSPSSDDHLKSDQHIISDLEDIDAEMVLDKARILEKNPFEEEQRHAIDDDLNRSTVNVKIINSDQTQFENSFNKTPSDFDDISDEESCYESSSFESE